MHDAAKELSFAFSGFRLDARRRVVSRDSGEPVLLAPKAFDTLLYFVERPGQLIDKQTLLDAIWPNVVVEENNLNQCISTLRRVLGEHPGEHRFIVTEPGRGYRFVAAVQPLPVSTPEGPVLEKPALAGADEHTTTRAPLRSRTVAPVVLVATFTLLIGAAIGWMLRHPPISEPAIRDVRLEAVLPAGLLLSGGPPSEPGQRPSRPSFALSPDGRYLVYAATDGKATRLFRRQLDQRQATAISGTDGASSPFFSPDGRSVGFLAGAQVKRVPIEGGEVRTISTVGATVLTLAGEPVPASWSDRDTILITSEDGGIHEVPATGGSAVPLTVDNGDGQHLFPQMLPGRRGLLFNVAKTIIPSEWDIVVEPLDGGEHRIVIAQGSDPRYVPSGHIVFARSGQLLAVPFDLARLQATGSEVVVLEDVMHGERGTANRLNIGVAQFSIADTGALAHVPGGIYPTLRRQLLWVDPDGRIEPLSDLEPDAYSWPRLSPDGEKLAYSVGEFGYGQLWVYDTKSRKKMKLTSDGHNAEEAWSPDGNQLVFDRLRGRSVLELHTVPSDGSGPAKPLGGLRGRPSSWSVDNVLAFVTAEGVSTLRVGDGSEPEPFWQRGMPQWPDFSPNGKWLAYASNETGRFEVYVRRFPSGPPVPVSADGGIAPLWSRDGRQLFYLSSIKDPELLVVDIDTEPVLEPSPPRTLFKVPTFPSTPVRSYDVDSDGRFVFVSTPVGIEPQPVTHVNIDLRWLEQLKRVAPTR